jgi:serine/threonine protein kinase
MTADIIYRDIAEQNIVMSTEMWPKGFHPIALSELPDGSGPAPSRARLPSRVKYIFIDYGLSTYVPRGEPTTMVTGMYGRDQSAPELSDTVPYNPFMLDIYDVGSMLRRLFTEVRRYCTRNCRKLRSISLTRTSTS